MDKLFERLLKLAVIVTFIYGLYTEQHYYSFFLRWLVFVSSIYFAYKSKQEIGVFGIRFLLIFNFTFAILFNPFIEFGFRETAWRIIDLLVCVLYAISLDWKAYAESLSQKGKLIYNLIKGCLWGSGALLVAIWFIFYQIGDPYYEFLLITKATTANGFIIYSEEHEDVAEQEGHSAVQVYDVYYEYTFTTKIGKTIKDHAKDRNPEPGYLKEANEKPIPIVVEYVPSNPEINRIKDMNLQCQTITEFIWRRLGLGILMLILFCSIGFVMIRKAIKEYLSERKKVIANI